MELELELTSCKIVPFVPCNDHATTRSLWNSLQCVCSQLPFAARFTRETLCTLYALHTASDVAEVHNLVQIKVKGTASLNLVSNLFPTRN